MCATACSAVVSPSFFIFGMCLCKIGVWWHWITQFSVCVFRLPGPRNWEHLPVHIWRGSGGAGDHPHVVSFQWPPTPTATHFLSVAEVACSMAKSNIVKPALFTQDIVQPDIFRKTRCAVSSPFYFSWKGAELRCLRRWLKQICYQLRSVFGPWLICWTATWWCRLSLASTACEALRFSLPGRMTQPWQR